MPFDHERLDVYRRSVDALDLCLRMIDVLPPRRRNIRDKIDRASCSVVANIAEGAGEFSPKEKARFYRIARRSAIELVAWLDITARREPKLVPRIREIVAVLQDVVAMLVALIKACDR